MTITTISYLSTSAGAKLIPDGWDAKATRLRDTAAPTIAANSVGLRMVIAYPGPKRLPCRDDTLTLADIAVAKT